MITCVLCTKRADPLFQAMADSFTRTLAVAGVAAELIVVDGVLWDNANRESALRNAVAGRFPYRHVPPKPCPWQGPNRKTSRDYFACSNARNTALALAHGSHVAFFDDCSVLDDNWLALHAQVAKSRWAMAGSYKSWNWATVEGGKITAGEPADGLDCRGTTPQKGYGAWLWGLNMSFPLEAALRINGYDETYDGQAGSEDCDFGVRLERSGMPIAFAPNCVVHQILTTHAPIDGHTFGKMVSKQKELMLRDGKMHYANEMLIQNLADDPGRILPSAADSNDFDLRQLRREALMFGMGAFPRERKLTVDWKDNQPLKDM